MAENEFPYGQEFNPVGGEFNENYISHVQEQRGSFKQEELQNNSVKDVEQASTVPSGEATADALSGTSGSSGFTGASTSTTASATTASGASTTSTVVTTTGVVATGGVVIGAIIIAAAAANIFNRNFSFSIEPMSRSLSYDLTVEFQTDNKLYVSIVDSENEEVAVNMHEITVNQAYVEGGKLFYDISGTFTKLNTDIDYSLNVYAFDSAGARFDIYTSETSFIVPYTPVVGASNFSYSEDPIEQAINFYLDVDIEEETVVYAHLLNEEGEEVVQEEFSIDKGNDAHTEGVITTSIEGSFSDIEPGVNYIFEAYGYASDDSFFTIYRHDQPLRLGTVGVQYIDGFEYSFDVFQRSARVFYSAVITQDETIYTRAVDENNNVASYVSNQANLADAYQGNDGLLCQIEATLAGLQAGVNYYFEIYAIDTENNEIILYRTEAPQAMASTNIISISKPTYSGNGFAKTLDYEFDIGVVGSDTIYVRATSNNGDTTRPNEHEITFDTNSGQSEQYFTIHGTLLNVIPGEDYYFEVYGNDSNKEQFSIYFEENIKTATIPIEEIANFATSYDEIAKTISYSFDVATRENHSVYVRLEDEQRRQLNINEHIATTSEGAASGYSQIAGEFANLDLNKPYHFSIYSFDDDDNQIELFKTVDPVEIPTPTYGVTDFTVTTDPVRKAIRVNASLFYNEENIGKNAIISLVDSNGDNVTGNGTLAAMSPSEATGNEHFSSEGDLYFYNDGHTFTELTSGETYTVTITCFDDSNPTGASTIVLKQKEILLETASQYLPYISLISYQADTTEQLVYLYYEYAPNGITYDHFEILVENINGSDVLSDEYQDVGMGPADNGNAVAASIDGSSGYIYSIKLYGVDSNNIRTLLIQHAIYY